MNRHAECAVDISRVLPPSRKMEGREWWLWGFAVAVTLVLTLAIIALTFPHNDLQNDKIYSLNLKEWVRGLTALVLMFDVYTVYQHLQLYRMRRQMASRDRLFRLITENAADMIAVIDPDGRRIYNSPAYYRILGYSPEELTATSPLEQVHPDDRARVLRAAEKARDSGYGNGWNIESDTRMGHGVFWNQRQTSFVGRTVRSMVWSW